MLNETDYYALYIAKLKSNELRDFYTLEDMRKKNRRENKAADGNTIITHILAGAGNVLVATGNKLLNIA